MIYDIESIHALFNGNAVKVTEHFKIRAKERDIKFSEVKAAILSGEIIEECPDDKPLPSVIILGYTDKGKPLHVVGGMDDDKLWLITVYYPSIEIWEQDYKTRREID